MTCQECKNYEDCNKRAMLKFEIYNDGWIDEPHLCTYVESICLRFEKKGGAYGMNLKIEELEKRCGVEKI